MSRTKILIGPPGTGKTTSLLDIIEKLMSNGTPPEEIAYLTFTRKGAEEGIDRACKRFGFDRKKFPFFRTLHSLAFNIGGLKRDEVIQTKHLREFGSKIGGYDFKHDYDSSQEQIFYGGGLGDKCLALIQLSMALRVDIETAWRLRPDFYVDWNHLSYFHRAYLKFKRETGLKDFADFLELPADPIPVKTFIVDEAQDLTPQQIAFAVKISKRAHEVILAGDDDQAIFEWSGASPKHLIALPGTRQVLGQSYRVPRSIQSLANATIKPVGFRNQKEWAPRDAQGEVNFVPSLDHLDFRPGSWFMLARHQYQLSGMEEHVRALGLPYKIGNRSELDQDYVRAVINFERVRRGEVISLHQVKQIGQYIYRFINPVVDKPYSWEDIRWPFEGNPDWMNALQRLSQDQREYIRGIKKRGESLTAEPRVKIGTIHSVKGGEADHVTILPDMSSKAEESMLSKNEDAERRVWYTGITRAKETLWLVEPTTKKFFDFTKL